MNNTSSNYTEKIIELYELLWEDFHKISFEQFKNYKFNSQQVMVLRQLYNTPYITLKELCEKLNLSKSTASGIVTLLEKQGVLVREIPEDNRRIVKLSLSDDFIRDFDFVYVKKGYLFEAIKTTQVEDIEKIIYGLEKFHTILDSSIKSFNTYENKNNLNEEN
ncbi:MarR family transcriptional regulator [Clostridium sp.]|uniref:MarR family winged helix-turn-helix transcriptional regulator n=1 Tax=Clostridium sp. TaxID=1506 RepID=UPI0025C25400|nr:MarR family transcriptional regulator [Clostridium sp.]